MEKIRLKLKAYDHRVLDRSVAAIIEAVKRTGAEIRGPIPMPTKIKRYTVLKSPHVNKKSREQFEMRVHARMIDIVSATTDTIDSLMKLDLAPEVNVEVRAMGKYGVNDGIYSRKNRNEQNNDCTIYPCNTCKSCNY